MTITSSPFGPTVLSGPDAEAFEHQVSDPRPYAPAEEALARGRVIAKDVRDTGKHEFSVKIR